MQISLPGIVSCASLLTLLLTTPGPVAHAAATEVRFIHAIPGATNLNMRMDYSNFAKNVKFRKCTSYKYVPEGEYLVDLTTKNEVTTVVPPAPRVFDPGMLITVMASGSVSGNPALSTVVIPLSKEFVPPLQARVVIINAIPDTPEVEVLLNGNVINPNLAFNGYEVPGLMASGKYELEVKQGGNTILFVPKLKLKSGYTNTVVLHGTLINTDGYPITAKNYLSK